MGKEVTIQTEVSKSDINIVELLASGYSVREIAEKKNEDKRRIQAIVDRLKNRFDCISVAMLTATFVRNKLIE